MKKFEVEKKFLTEEEKKKKKKEKKKKKSKQSVVGQTLDESRVGKELNDDEQEDFGCKD